MSGKVSVQWLCWQPTPYNRFLFRALSGDPEIELQVHFVSSKLSSHPWQSSLTEGFESRCYRTVFGIDWSLLRRAARDPRSFFVVSGWNDLTMLLVMAILALRQRPFALWTDTPDSATSRPPLKAIARETFLRWIFKRATYVLGTGQRALDLLREMGCATKKLVNFPFFVDLSTCLEHRGWWTVTHDADVIRFVSSGRLQNGMKGHQVALSALHRARELSGCSNFEYVLAGTGPDREVLQQMAKQLDLEEHVKFAGWLEPEQLARLFATSHALIHPSFYDPFPVAVLEAMAAGLAVMGSDGCGSVIDRIRHGENGLIHRAGDVEELGGQIAQILQDPRSLRTMGDEARRTAEDWPVSRGVVTIKSLLDHPLAA